MGEETAIAAKRCKLSLKGQRSPASNVGSLMVLPEKCLSGILASQRSPDLFSMKAENFSPRTVTEEEISVFASESSDENNELFVALPNIGNTCFMNSVLHVLRITPQFVPWLHRAAAIKFCNNDSSELSVLHKIYRILNEMEKQKFSANSELKDKLELHLRWLINSFANQNPQFTVGQQFDAHEFLCWLVAILKGQPHGGKRAAKDTFVPALLEGKAKNVVFCNECETSIEHEDVFWDVKMPVSCIYEAEVDGIYSSLRAENVLRGEDKYLCSLCLQMTEARHSMRILSLPPVLIIHINAKWQNVEKSPFKVLEKLPCIKDGCDNNCRDPRHLFRLYAVLVHLGSTSQFGHYVTLTRQPLNIANAENGSTGRRYRTRSKQMIWENCCFGKTVSKSEWVLCDDDKIVSLDSTNQYFQTVASGSSARPAILWYERLQ